MKGHVKKRGDRYLRGHLRRPRPRDRQGTAELAPGWYNGRGLITRNVAVVAPAPKQRSLQRTEGTSLTEDQLRHLMRIAVGHRLFPLYSLAAMTGMRRNEVLGLKCSDIDLKKKRLHLNCGLVPVGYEVHQTRGKTKIARRTIALDDTTLTILAGWRAFQAAEFAAVGITNDEAWVFTDGDGEPVHPYPLGLRGVPPDRPQRRRTDNPIS